MPRSFIQASQNLQDSVQFPRTQNANFCLEENIIKDQGLRKKVVLFDFHIKFDIFSDFKIEYFDHGWEKCRFFGTKKSIIFYPYLMILARDFALKTLN